MFLKREGRIWMDTLYVLETVTRNQVINEHFKFEKRT